jgi:hypothetical protein
MKVLFKALPRETLAAGGLAMRVLLPAQPLVLTALTLMACASTPTSRSVNAAGDAPHRVTQGDAVEQPAQRRPAPAADVDILTLTPYQTAGHRTVQASVGGQTLPFIFDTGGGVTLITPALAEAAGCTPIGRLVGYRMRGERVDFGRCDGVVPRAAGATLTDRTVGVFDINALLPPDWPALGGLITLASFEGRLVTVDLAGGEVRAAPSPAPAADAVRMNVVRQASGFSLVVLIPSPTPTGDLWLELDTGSSAPLLLAPHAAKMLGVETTQKGDGPPVFEAASLSLPGVGRVQTPGAVVDMIYDGNIGAPLIERFIWELDLAHERVRVLDR